MGRSLEGKVAVVTGSGQGIGRGIALYFAQEGAKVVTNNRKPLTNRGNDSCKEELSEEEYQKMEELRGDAESTARQIIRMGGEAVPFYGDVSDFGTAGELIKTAIDTYGRIDILVNNAAGLGQGTIVNTSESDWDYMTQAKMKGAFNTMRHAVPYMMEQGTGTVLNCASNAWVGIDNLCAYSAGNSGVVGLTKAAAKELVPYGITVNSYCPQAESPGHIKEFSRTVKSLREEFGDAAQPSPEKMKQIEEDHGNPMNVAPFLVYLCTEDARQISGAVFGVTASGRIEYYSEPVITSTVWKKDAPWTVDELREKVPQELLRDYMPLSERDSWGKEQNLKAEEDLSNSVIFARGEKMAGANKEAYINMILGFDHPSKCSIGNVTFAPGAHNAWHRHFGYQVLMVTGGQGYYQEWGKKARLLNPGDVVVVEPGVKHWHGATPDHWFVHIGMILNEEKGTEGLEDLTEEEYLLMTDGINQ